MNPPTASLSQQLLIEVTSETDGIFMTLPNTEEPQQNETEKEKLDPIMKESAVSSEQTPNSVKESAVSSEQTPNSVKESAVSSEQTLNSVKPQYIPQSKEEQVTSNDGLNEQRSKRKCVIS